MENSFKKIGFILLFILISAGGIFVLTRKPKAVEGVETFPDQGRNHVPAGTAEEYNSNPPTSGPHYAEWEKPGIYDKVLEDGKLVHSLEHGYIVISYNCTKSLIFNFQFSIFKRAYAHETEEIHEEPPATGSAGIKTDSVSEWKNNPDCQKLVGELKLVMEKSKAKRLILVPRPNLDSNIALTAWGKIDKMNHADESRILRFIRAYHNKGPERTME